MSSRALPLWQQSVTYEAVGGTRDADFRDRVPAGFRPIMHRVRIGDGAERWKHATTRVLSWGVQRYAGYEIIRTDAPDAAAVPFGPDGLPVIMPGDSVVLKIPLGLIRLAAPARVIYVIDEPHRKGFAYGTLAGHPERGEEAFIVEQAADGSVWFELRAFSRPANLFWWLGIPIGRLVEAHYTRRYLESLAGPIS